MDDGQKATEKKLKQIEARINREYKQAVDEIEIELSDYLRRYEKKDETWRRWVEEGVKTQKEYEQWRLGQMAVGKRWNDQKEIIAHQLFEVSEDAKNKIKSICPEVYAENFNYSTYQVEKDAHIDTSFTLYSKESVQRLIEDDPDVLPPVGKKVAKQIAEGKAVRWNRQQLQSVMIQGILQGDSIPKLATRLANTVGDRDRKASIRNARTMATSAQNAGRVAAYKRAQDKGVDLEQMWIATMDNRTRHSHRWLDGEVRPVGEAFSNGCEYPADPKGDPAEIYNCRCTLRGVVKGLERRSGKYRDTSAIDGMSYDEWRDAKAKSNPITLPEEKAKAIKGSYINDYKNGGYSAGAGSGNVGEHMPPIYLESIDYSNKDLVKSKLKEYEKIIADEPIENAIVICADGDIYRCFGNLNGVNPYDDLGDKIINSSMTHNHPKGSFNEYSFSRADQNAYDTYKQEILRGIDELYTYEFHRDSTDIDERMTLAEVMQDGAHNFRHSQVIAESIERGYGYRRVKRE